MKRLNKKAFTLIELLAVIIILGVLLLIAVPAVSRYIQESREDTYATNLSKFVDAVSPEVNSYNSEYTFATNQYLVVPITCLELERGSSKDSPFGPYDPMKSYVVVVRKSSGSGFDYYVAALDDTGYGTKLIAADELDGRNSISDLKGDEEDTIEPITSLTSGSTTTYNVELDLSELGFIEDDEGSLPTLTAKIALPGSCKTDKIID